MYMRTELNAMNTGMKLIIRPNRGDEGELNNNVEMETELMTQKTNIKISLEARRSDRRSNKSVLFAILARLGVYAYRSKVQ